MEAVSFISPLIIILIFPWIHITEEKLLAHLIRRVYSSYMQNIQQKKKKKERSFLLNGLANTKPIMNRKCYQHNGALLNAMWWLIDL